MGSMQPPLANGMRESLPIKNWTDKRLVILESARSFCADNGKGVSTKLEFAQN